MLQQRPSLIAAQHLKPLTQGKLSRLCGLYSILNAIQLALYPRLLSRDQLQDLYGHGIGHLSRRRQLRRVLGVGMDEGVWTELWDALAIHANHRLGSDLICSPLLRGQARRDVSKALVSVESALNDQNPVLACFGGALNHLTVIAGLTERRIQFFDSSRLCWVKIENVSLIEGGKRHWLMPSTVVALVDDW